MAKLSENQRKNIQGTPFSRSKNRRIIPLPVSIPYISEYKDLNGEKMKKLDYDDILRVSSREDLGYAVSKKLKEIAEEIKELSVWKNVKESKIYAVHILIEVLEPKEPKTNF